ncbi:MAG: presenilin family intramembrane aspartyl protease PSH [Thermoplasmatota archaeon]
MQKEREARNGPEGPVEGEEEKRPAFRPFQALPPILLMGVFIIVTVGLSLIVGPLYDSYGLSSDFEEFAQGDYWYLYAFGFVVLMVVVALVILLLRKLLKRRKLKLKYLFAFVVFTSTFVVVQPFIDMVFNGAPPVWDEYDLDVEGMRGAFPLDPYHPGTGLVVVTDTSFHVMERKTYEYSEIWSVEGLSNTYDPHFNGGLWVLSGNTSTGSSYWTIDDGGLLNTGPIENNDTGMSLLGVNIWLVEDVPYLTSFWAGTDGNWSVLMWKHGTADPPQKLVPFGVDEGPIYPVFGWSDDINLFYNRTQFKFIKLIFRDNEVAPRSGGGQGVINFTWVKTEGSSLMTYTADGIIYLDRGMVYGNLIWTGFYTDGGSYGPETRPYDTSLIENGYLCSFASSSEDPDNAPGDVRLVYASGKTLYETDGKDDQAYLLTDEPVAVFQDGYKGDVWIVFDNAVVSGKLEDSERGQLHVQIISFLIGAVLVIALLKKPKWWLVDLGGLLMGAGVIAIMGISFPILFTLLLLVLLAIYDFISVYKTKHMIALADSVVEAKMPILLVFPMKWSYRYEDETNLMDPKRKRESLFMGLGDVIIPGILILSIASFLSPVGGVRLFGLIYPPVAVALFALAGMLAGWGALMFFVIKGKAHAGLPPINSGTILGFIIGHLIIYGSFVFW